MVKVGFFCLRFGCCLLFWLLFVGCWLRFCGAVLHGLWCAFMLVSVAFAHVDGGSCCSETIVEIKVLLFDLYADDYCGFEAPWLMND